MGSDGRLAIFYTLEYLAHLKEIGANVLHGYDTYVYEFSKARQLRLFDRLGVRYPRARVMNHSPRVVGFDPFPRLVDYVLVRAGLAEPASV